MLKSSGLKIVFVLLSLTAANFAHASEFSLPSALTAAEEQQNELAAVGVDEYTSPDYKPGIVRHIVLFRFANGITTDQKKEAMQKFLVLKTLARRNGAPYILSLTAGNNISGEGADQGLEQGFIVTFKSQGDRNYYVGQPVVMDASHYDPAHQQFKDFVGPLLDKDGALVFDFAN